MTIITRRPCSRRLSGACRGVGGTSSSSDPSWYADEVFDLLARHHVACCIHDMAGSATGRRAVGPFVYARFHGPAQYSGRYDDQTLDDWAAWFADRLREGRPVFAYFNNDAGGDAPRDALRLRQRLQTLLSR